MLGTAGASSPRELESPKKTLIFSSKGEIGKKQLSMRTGEVCCK